MKKKNDVIDTLSNIDISNYIWQPYRKYTIPKSEFSYRVATQLDPIDNILFAAIIYEYGNKVESKRIDKKENKVFNYRFSPTTTGMFYDKKDAWKNFWDSAHQKSKKYEYVIILDIADFYNQIYHHTLENQLIACEFPNQVIKAIRNMLQNITQLVSRGIPVGPHASHLLAEMCLIPIDNSLVDKDIEFCRFADDIILFANSYDEAKSLVYKMVMMLDTYKLLLQQAKTKIYTIKEFNNLYIEMKNDDPINDLERSIEEVLSGYDIPIYGGFEEIEFDDIDSLLFSEENIEELLSEYLLMDVVDYNRIGWLYKRLSHINISTALKPTLKHFTDLFPIIADISKYYLSLADDDELSMHKIGDDLLDLLSTELISENEYLQLLIFNIFSNRCEFNHINKLIKMYSRMPSNLKREIILAYYLTGRKSWISEIKHEYSGLNIWAKRALLIASINLTKDERKYFLSSITTDNNLSEKILIDCIKKI